MNQRLLTLLSRAIVSMVVFSVLWLSLQMTQLPAAGDKSMLVVAQLPADSASMPLR